MHVPSDYYPIYRWLLLLSLLVLMILFSCSGCCFCCLLVVVAVTVVFITLSCFARYVQSQHLGWAGKHQQHQQIPSHWCESLHCQEMAASRGYALLIPSRVGEARPVSSSQGWEMGRTLIGLWHCVDIRCSWQEAAAKIAPMVLVVLLWHFMSTVSLAVRRSARPCGPGPCGLLGWKVILMLQHVSSEWSPVSALFI